MFLIQPLLNLYIFMCLVLLFISSIMAVFMFIRDIIKWGCIYYWNNAPLHCVLYKIIQIINIHNETQQINHTIWYIDNYIPYNTIQEIKNIYREHPYFRSLCIQHGINNRVLLITQLGENTRTTPITRLITQYQNTTSRHPTMWCRTNHYKTPSCIK